MKSREVGDGTWVWVGFLGLGLALGSKTGLQRGWKSLLEHDCCWIVLGCLNKSTLGLTFRYLTLCFVGSFGVASISVYLRLLMTSQGIQLVSIETGGREERLGRVESLSSFPDLRRFFCLDVT